MRALEFHSVHYRILREWIWEDKIKKFFVVVFAVEMISNWSRNEREPSGMEKAAADTLDSQVKAIIIAIILISAFSYESKKPFSW